MSVWNISANYVLVPLKFNLKCNIWKPFLKSSPLDFSGERLWNTSLVVFLWLHSFSLVVKWPEYARVYRTNFLSGYYVKSAQWSEGPVLLQEVLGSGLTYYGILCYTSVCILSSKLNHFGKDCHPNVHIYIVLGRFFLVPSSSSSSLHWAQIEHGTFGLTIDRGNHYDMRYSTTSWNSETRDFMYAVWTIDIVPNSA